MGTLLTRPRQQQVLRVLEIGRHLDPVRRASTDVGLRLTDGNDWSVLWSYRVPWAAEAFTNRRRGPAAGPTLLNHMPGTLPLASKAHLPALAHEAGVERSIPRSFLLPDEASSLMRAVANEGLRDSNGLPRWLLKSRQHRGVRVLPSASSLALANYSPAIVQRRVEPLLLSGLRRAFDVGLYILVTSVRPLRVFAYDLALVRFCEHDFPTSAAAFESDPLAFVISHYTPIWSLDSFSTALRGCDGSAACALRTRLAADGHDGNRIFDEMHRISLALLGALNARVRAGLAQHRLTSDEVFELFRFDFLLNDRAEPILTEVNLSPNLAASHPQDGRVKDALVRDVLRMVTVRFNASRSVAELAAAEESVRGGFRRLHS